MAWHSHNGSDPEEHGGAIGGNGAAAPGAGPATASAGPDMTPRQIVAELDRYIIGQQAAKRAVALALRNRWRRQQLGEDLRDEVMPKNIIMIGPTGVGKTEIARRLARLARAPFLKVEASKFTEVGYVGRDVESMVRDLVELGINLVRAEAEERVEARARQLAEERLVEQLEGLLARRRESPPATQPSQAAPGARKTFIVGSDGVVHTGGPARSRPQILAGLRQGLYDEESVEIEVTDTQNPVVEILGTPPQGMEPIDLGDVLGQMFPKRRKKKRLKVREALAQLVKEEIARLVDMDQITQDALERTQQNGIIFLDEIDKIAGREGAHGRDVSREGVQRDLLPIVEGSSVNTRHGVVKTDHILFIAAGAFHVSRPSDLIPELQGRFPIRVELESLTREDFQRILTEPTNSLTRQYTALLETEGIAVDFEPQAIDTIAEMAFRVNESLENIGARRLHTIMERVFEPLSFDAPELGPQQVCISAQLVRERLEGILSNEDLSRYIL